MSERLGVVEKPRGIIPVVAGAQADLVNRRFVTRLAEANLKGRGDHRACVAQRLEAGHGTVRSRPSAGIVASQRPVRRDKFSGDGLVKQTFVQGPAWP